MKYILYTLCAFMLILCIAISLNPKNEITRIDFARSGAWSDHGAAFSIDTSLIYKYYSKGIDGAQYYYVGRVSRRFWDTLNRKLEATNYQSLKTFDPPGFADDANYFELIVHWKNMKQRIVREACYPCNNPLASTFNWLNDSHDNVNMYPVKETIKFETTYQAGGLDADWQKYIDSQQSSPR